MRRTEPICNTFAKLVKGIQRITSFITVTNFNGNEIFPFTFCFILWLHPRNRAMRIQRYKITL